MGLEEGTLHGERDLQGCPLSRPQSRRIPIVRGVLFYVESYVPISRVFCLWKVREHWLFQIWSDLYGC